MLSSLPSLALSSFASLVDNPDCVLICSPSVDPGLKAFLLNHATDPVEGSKVGMRLIAPLDHIPIVGQNAEGFPSLTLSGNPDLDRARESRQSPGAGDDDTGHGRDEILQSV